MNVLSPPAWLSATAIFVGSLSLLLSQPRSSGALPGIMGGLSAAVVLFTLARGALASGPVWRLALLTLGAILCCGLYGSFCKPDVMLVGLGGIAGSFGTVIGALRDGRSLPRRDAVDRTLVAAGAALVLTGAVALASAGIDGPGGVEVLFAVVPVVAGLVALVAGLVRGRERARWLERVIRRQVPGWRLSVYKVELVLARAERREEDDPAVGVYPARVRDGWCDGPGEGLRWALRELVAFVFVPVIVFGIPLGVFWALFGAVVILGAILLTLCGLWLLWSRC
jgi:hypothetical protein